MKTIFLSDVIFLAYDTPVFDEVIGIDYYTEHLTFQSGYSANSYTITFGSVQLRLLTCC
ncbi:MAG: hypothetical protein LBS55_06875 [Prevotellaceae bacterium]|nr:hypothetical protein [Prevotellaceae bacterium]